ncbi:MAG: family 20 glycosylhydrolase [Bacilli bacterium]|nr:family 20 glycosylhydrolase [Bacilli bacterium]
MKELGYMIDCSRGQVPRVETIKKFIDIISKFNYTYLMLYTEDMFEMNNHPYFGYMRGRYSKEELKEIDAYAHSKGMELRPCIQTLAHMERIQRHGPYRDLYDINDIFLVKDERVYKLIEDMISTMSETISSRVIHIGMDEAWRLSRGRYQDIHGPAKIQELMEYHLDRVNNIAKKYGYKCYIWGDMLMSSYLNGDVVKLPENITPFIWRYSPIGNKETDKEIKLYKKISDDRVAYAGGIDKWRGFAPHNSYAFLSIKEQILGIRKHNIDNFLLTAWSDGAADASIFSGLPGAFYASVLFKEGKFNKECYKQFLDVVGMSFLDYLHIDDLDRFNQEKSRFKGNINDLSFIHLYNDPLQNIYNEVEDNSFYDFYNKVQKTMQKLSKNEDFGYIFASLASLAKLLKTKVGLASDLYKAYKNKEDLSPIILRAKKVIKCIDEFIKTYEFQWLKEAKGMGYEKQIIRLGGLKERFRFLIVILSKYQNNEIDKIDELEEEQIPSNMCGHKVNPGADVVCSYRHIVSAGALIEI